MDGQIYTMKEGRIICRHVLLKLLNYHKHRLVLYILMLIAESVYVPSRLPFWSRAVVLCTLLPLSAAKALMKIRKCFLEHLLQLAVCITSGNQFRLDSA